MSKTQKSVLPQNLDRYSVFIEDREPLSTYFRLSDVPDVLTGGKNAFLMAGTKELNPATEVKVEIKDSLGNTIFLAPIKNYQEGLARLISIEVYEDTPPGEATITIMGELRVTAAGKPVPEIWKGRYNVRWQKKINVQPASVNTTKVRLYNTPIINVSEILTPYLNPYTSSIVNLSGSASLQTVLVPSFQNNINKNSYYINNASFPYVRDMEGGIVTIPAYNVTASVLRVLNSSSMEISTGSFGWFSVSPISMSYQPPPRFVFTSLTKSLADVRVSNLTTFAGDIARAKVYARSVEDGGTYQLIEDRRLEAVGVMLTSSVSGLQDVPMGTFNNTSVISNYWRMGRANSSTGYTVDSSVTMSYSSARIIEGIYNSSDTALVSSSYTAPRFFFGVQTPLNFNQELEYTLTGMLACYKADPNFNAVCEVYLSGSAFPSANRLGQLIQTYQVENGKSYTLFDRSALNFYAPLTGQGSLNFVVYGGEWHFADISIDSATETSFNPDEVRVVSTITGRRFERLMFKVELLDNNSNIVPINIESSPYYFDGGNLYIQGRDNRLIGQISILNEGDGGRGVVIAAHPSASTMGASGDTFGPTFPVAPENLANYTGSGLVTMYSGSNPFGGGKTPISGALGLQILGGPIGGGSILDWNSYTGILKIRGDIQFLPGTSLSQSFSSLESAVVSSGSYDPIARAQILQIVSGTFPDGTYLSYDRIFSPTITGLVIGGVQGYISQSFRVGNVLNGNGIILTAMGFSSGGIYYPNKPAIFIGGNATGTGSFNSADTQFFVASSSNGPIFSLGNIFSVQPSGISSNVLTISGTVGVYSGSGWKDVRTYIFDSDAQSSASMAEYVRLGQLADSASISQLSASFINFTGSVFWPYSASQSTINYYVTSSIIAQSASMAQISASMLNLSSGSGFWADSASNALMWATQSANNIAQSASISQISASFIDFTGSVFWPLSASQARLNASQSANNIAQSASIAQISASFLDFTGSVFWPFSASQALLNATQSANNIAQSASISQISASFLDFTGSVFWPFSASQALVNATQSANNTAQSASISQISASFINFSSSTFWPFSASQALINATQSANNIAQSGSISQISASFLDFTGSVFWPFSASQSANNAAQTASIMAQSSSISQLSASFLDFTGSVFWPYSASQAQIIYNNYLSASAASSSLVQQIEFRAVTDAANRIKLPTSIKTGSYAISGGLFLEQTAMGFWQPARTTAGGLLLSGNLSQNYPVVFNSSGQFRVAHSQSWDYTAQSFSESIAFANESLAIQTSRLLVNTPGLTFASTKSSAAGDQVLNYIKLGGGGVSSALTSDVSDNLTGSYLDGTGTARFGYVGSHLRFNPTAGALFISTSYFNLQALLRGTETSTRYAYDTFVGAGRLSAHTKDYGPTDPASPLWGSGWFGSGSINSNVNGGNVTPNQNSGEFSTARTYIGLTDNFYVEADVSRLDGNPGGAGDLMGVVGRCNSGSAFSGSDLGLHSINFQFERASDSAVNLMFRQYINGVAVKSHNLSASYAWPFSAYKHMKMGFIGNQVDCFISDAYTTANEVLIGSVTLPATASFNDSTSSYAGFVFNNYGTSTGQFLDNWSAKSYPPAYSTNSISLTPYYIALGNPSPGGNIPTETTGNKVGFVVSSTGELWLGSGSISSSQALAGTGSYLHFNPTLGVIQLKTNAMFISSSNALVLASGSGGNTNVIKLWGGSAQPTSDAQSDIGTGSYLDGTGAFRFGYKNNTIQFNPTTGFYLSASYFNLLGGSTLAINPYYIALGNPIPAGTIPTSGYKVGLIASNTGELWLGSGSISSGQALAGTGSYLHFNPALGVIQLKTSAMFISSSNTLIMASGSGGYTNVISLWSGSNSASSNAQGDLATGSYIDGMGNYRFGYAGQMIQGGAYGMFVSTSYLNLKAGTPTSIDLNPYYFAIGNPIPAGTIPTSGYKVGFIVSNTGELWLGSGSISSGQALAGTGSYLHFHPTLGVLQLKSNALFISTSNSLLMASGSGGYTNVHSMWTGNISASANAQGDLATGSYIDGAGNYRFGYAGQMLQGGAYGMFISTSYLNLKAGNPTSIDLNPYYFAIGNPIPAGTIPTSGYKVGMIVSNTGELWIGSGSISSGQALAGTGSYLHFNPTMGVIQLKTNALFISSSNTFIMASGSGGYTNVISLWSGSKSASANAASDLATGSYIDGMGNYRFGYSGQMLQGGSYGLFISTSYFNLAAGAPYPAVVNWYDTFIDAGDVYLGSHVPNIGTSYTYSGGRYKTKNTGFYFVSPLAVNDNWSFNITIYDNFEMKAVVTLDSSYNGSHWQLSAWNGCLFTATRTTNVSSSVDFTRQNPGDGSATNLSLGFSWTTGTSKQMRMTLQGQTITYYIANSDGSSEQILGTSTVSPARNNSSNLTAALESVPYGTNSISSLTITALGTNPSGNTIEINPYFISIGDPKPAGAVPTSGYKVGMIVANTGELWIGSGSISSGRALAGTGSYLHFNPTLGVIQLKSNALFVSTSNALVMASGSGGYTNAISLWTGTNSASANAQGDLATGSYIDGAGNYRFGYAGQMLQGGAYGMFISTSYLNLKAGTPTSIDLNPYYFAIGNPIPAGTIPTSGYKVGMIVSYTGELWIGSGSISSGRALAGTGSYLHFNPTLGVIQLKTNALFLSSSNTFIMASGSDGFTNVISLWSGSISTSASPYLDSGTGSYIDGYGNFRFGYRNNHIFGSAAGMFISTSYFNLQAGSPSTLVLNPTYIALGNPIPTGIPMNGNSKQGFIVSNTGDFWLGSGSIDSSSVFGPFSTGSYLHYASNVGGRGVLNFKTDALFITSSNMTIMASGSGGYTNMIRLWSGANSASANAATDLATGSYIDGAGNFRFGYAGNVVQFAPGAGFQLSSSYFQLKGGNPTSIQINPYFIAIGSLATLGNIPTSGYSSGAILSNTGEFWIGSGSISAGQALGGIGSYLHFNPSLNGKGVLQLRTDALFISSSATKILASGSSGFNNMISLGVGSSSMAPWTDLATGSYMDGFGNFRLGHSGSYIVFNPDKTGSLLIQSDKIHINSSKFRLDTIYETASLSLGAATSPKTGSGIWMDDQGYFRAGAGPNLGNSRYIEYRPTDNQLSVYNLKATNITASNMFVDSMAPNSIFSGDSVIANTIYAYTSSVVGRYTGSLNQSIEFVTSSGFIVASASSPTTIFEVGSYVVPQAGASIDPATQYFTPAIDSNAYQGNIGGGFDKIILTDTVPFTLAANQSLVNNTIAGASNWQLVEANNPSPVYYVAITSHMSCSVNGGAYAMTQIYSRIQAVDAAGTYGRFYDFSFSPPSAVGGGATVNMIIQTRFQSSGVA